VTALLLNSLAHNTGASGDTRRLQPTDGASSTLTIPRVIASDDGSAGSATGATRYFASRRSSSLISATRSASAARSSYRSSDCCVYVVFEHVVSFALKETRFRYIYHFRVGDDTTETHKTRPSRIWKCVLICWRRSTFGVGN
jgi:hypothetical protein